MKLKFIQRILEMKIIRQFYAGATISMLYWDAEFCQKLADKGFFVNRYDNRDAGKSTFYESGTTPYGIVDLTNDAISILDVIVLTKQIL